MKKIMVFIFGLCIALSAIGEIKRSKSAVREFKKNNPCPATGLIQKSCHGYEVDHIIALCSGGADTPDNMQWLSVETHKAKTSIDVKACRK